MVNSSMFKYFSRMKETEGFVLVSDDSFLRNLFLNIIRLIYNLPNIYLCTLLSYADFKILVLHHP